MRTTLGRYGLITILALTFFSEDAYSQIVKIEPEQPRWGQTLIVTYNPKAEGARFSAADEVYAVGHLFFSDHSTKKVWAKMNKVADVFKYELLIEDNLAFATFYFLTLDDWDARATAGTMIYRSDGIPARGAYERKMTSPYLVREYKELFDKEIALYPDNYAVYRDKWFVAGAFDRDQLASLVAEDMKKLPKQVKGEPVDWLYSLAYGYLLLKQEEKSREILKKMIEQYPTSPLTAHALNSYEHQVFAQQIKGEGPEEMKKLAWQLMQRYPNTEFARERIAFTALAGQKDFPLATMEAICQIWIEDEPDNPVPYFNLALAYNIQKQKIDRAASLIEKAIDLLLQGKLRLYEDISGQMTAILLPAAYQTSAEIALEQRNYAKALAAVKAAQALKKETDHELYALEGQIWQRLSNPSRAESAYLEAWRRGSKEAEDSLKALYQKKHGSLVGFEEYFSKKKETRAASPAGKEPAPSVRVTTLDGQLIWQVCAGKSLCSTFGSLAVLRAGRRFPD